MFCPNCGREVKDGTKFCPYCGTKINLVSGQLLKETARAEKKEKSHKFKRSHKKLIITLISVFLVIVSLSALTYFYIAPIFFQKISNSYLQRANNIISSSLSGTVPDTSVNVSEAQSFSSAKSDLNRAITINPKNIEARENLTAISAIEGDLKEADKQIEGILRVEPDNEYAILMKNLLSEEGLP